MSGSPVIFKTRRPVTLFKSLENNMTLMSRYAVKLIGIYSGRIGAENELQAQLGIVWKFSVINEIIYQAACPAANPDDQAH